MSKIAKSIAVLGVVAGLGVAALPLSSYAATETVNINAVVDETIAFETSASDVTMNLVPGGAAVEKSVDATVTVNNNMGYLLTIRDSDGETALVSENNDKIEAGITLSGAQSAWAYKGGNMGTWTAITTSDVRLVNTGGPETAPDPVELGTPSTTTITFAAYAAAGQDKGTYKGGVVLTALPQATAAPNA